VPEKQLELFNGSANLHSGEIFKVPLEGSRSNRAAADGQVPGDDSEGKP